METGRPLRTGLKENTAALKAAAIAVGAALSSGVAGAAFYDYLVATPVSGGNDTLRAIGLLSIGVFAALVFWIFRSANESCHPPQRPCARTRTASAAR